jgi:jumonji domain-containing protein 7
MSTSKAVQAREYLNYLSDEYHAYNPSVCPVREYPSAVEFSHQVSRGRPCIYQVSPTQSDTHQDIPTSTPQQHERAQILQYPAFTWTPATLIAKLPDTTKIEVAATPTGLADALYFSPDLDDHIFVQPATVEMSLSDLLAELTADHPPSPTNSPTRPRSKSKPEAKPIIYLQSQNSNLTLPPLSHLLRDIPPTLPFATPTLGAPDAINIWIGDGRSITSTHRDPYENLYLVLRGRKTFRVWAPVDELGVGSGVVRRVRTARFVSTPGLGLESGSGNENEKEDERGIAVQGIQPDSGWKVLLDHPDDIPGSEEDWDHHIPWIFEEDETETTTKPTPAHANTKTNTNCSSSSMTITVEAGQMLYLPAGWFHQVKQECGTWDDGSTAPCVAVNYWFDMDYEGERYVMRQLVGRLVEDARGDEKWDGMG